MSQRHLPPFHQVIETVSRQDPSRSSIFITAHSSKAGNATFVAPFCFGCRFSVIPVRTMCILPPIREARRLDCKPAAQAALQDQSHVAPMRFVRHLPTCLRESDADRQIDNKQESENGKLTTSWNRIIKGFIMLHLPRRPDQPAAQILQFSHKILPPSLPSSCQSHGPDHRHMINIERLSSCRGNITLSIRCGQIHGPLLTRNRQRIAMDHG